MGLLSDGAEFLADIQTDCDGEIVQYERPLAISPTPLSAVVGGPGAVVDSSTNMPARIESRLADFLIRVADFAAVMPTRTLPQKGDQIVRTLKGRRYRYRVFAEGQTPAFEYSDRQQLRYRVHARLDEVGP